MAKKKSAKKRKTSALTLNLPLDAKKIQEIQACLKSGSLKIEIAEVDLGKGKLGSAYIYD